MTDCAIIGTTGILIFQTYENTINDAISLYWIRRIQDVVLYLYTLVHYKKYICWRACCRGSGFFVNLIFWRKIGSIHDYAHVTIFHVKLTNQKIAAMHGKAALTYLRCKQWELSLRNAECINRMKCSFVVWSWCFPPQSRDSPPGWDSLQVTDCSVYKRQSTKKPGRVWKQPVSLFPNFHETWWFILLVKG